MEVVKLIEQPDLSPIGLYGKKADLRSLRLDRLDFQWQELFAAEHADEFYLIVRVNHNSVRN